MKRKVENGKWKIVVLAFCILHFAFSIASCSIPNLEKPECTAAREAVRDFYSFHFGGDMKFTRVNVDLRQKFLSGNLIENLSNKDESATDYFTATDDYPKAFRVGNCTVIEPDKRAKLGVLLFWKTDTRSEQREIHVEAVRENGRWLIDKVAD